jgi:hypothetical protein
MNLPGESRKYDDHFLDFGFCEISSVFEIVACVIPRSASWFQGLFEKPTFFTCYGPIKKNLVQFRAVEAFLLTRFLIIIQIFWNNVCTHFFHVQISCNNLVDLTFVNMKFISDHSNRQMSILTNESPHTVDVCACSHRGGASRLRFIFHCLSPIYKSLCHRNT